MSFQTCVLTLKITIRSVPLTDITNLAAESRCQSIKKSDAFEIPATDWKSELLNMYPNIGDENLNRICVNGLEKCIVDAIKKINPKPNDGCTVDPLVVLLPDHTDPNSLIYFSQGNYGLLPPGAAMGGLAMPVPPVPVALQPPNAFGRFIAGIVGFTDRSQGRQMVFQCPDLYIVHSARDICSSSDQFRRLGPVMAPMIHGAGAAAQPSFVTVLVFNDLRSNPAVLLNFNSTP